MKNSMPRVNKPSLKNAAFSFAASSLESETTEVLGVDRSLVDVDMSERRGFCRWQMEGNPGSLDLAWIGSLADRVANFRGNEGDSVGDNGRMGDPSLFQFVDGIKVAELPSGRTDGIHIEGKVLVVQEGFLAHGGYVRRAKIGRRTVVTGTIDSMFVEQHRYSEERGDRHVVLDVLGPAPAWEEPWDVDEPGSVYITLRESVTGYVIARLNAREIPTGEHRLMPLNLILGRNVKGIVPGDVFDVEIRHLVSFTTEHGKRISGGSTYGYGFLQATGDWPN